MNYYIKMGSALLSGFFNIFYSPEEHMFRNQQGGIFLGQSSTYSLPLLFNQDLLLNPHIFVTGVTGSGKSYFLKSLIIKSALLSETKIIIIDITGEYGEIANYLGASKKDLGKFLLGGDLSNVAYYDLSVLENENKKVEEASAILSEIVENMRKRGTKRKERAMVILDEAWKLLARDKLLETPIREGRKYGVGAVLASQMLEDIEAHMLSNFATIFVFKIQNKSSLEMLAKNYHLSDMQIEMVQNLKQGGCMVVQAYKDKSSASFFIEKIPELSIPKMLRLMFGGKMIEISEFEIKKALVKLGYDPAKTLQNISSGEEIDIQRLISLLKDAGMKEMDILHFLRHIGINDLAIADAFAAIKNGN